MAKKDKKSKSVEKKLRTAEKTNRKTAAKEKKASKKAGSGPAIVDADDQDIDAVLAEYAAQQLQFNKVTETVITTPPVRSGGTLTPSPEPSSDDLFLFGGETFNGSIAHFFNDLCIYNTANNIWRVVTSPNSPLPRSGHWITPTQHAGGTLWLFGGEFSSPKQNTFYHYNDFWSLSCKSREWARVETKKAPPARSGHRMIAWKNFLVLWGGFQDTSASTKYLSDLWVFDVTAYTWTQVILPTHGQRPDARSSFSFLPHDDGAVLFGGYSKTKVTGSAAMMGKNAKKSTATEIGNVHDDTWILRLDPDVTKIRWERRKKPGNAPNPKRVGVTMAPHKGRGIMFGGVHDAVETDENLDSIFFNDLFAWSTDRNRFFPLILRKPRHQQNKRSGNERAAGNRRDRGKESEQELLENLARLEGRSPTDTPAETPAAETPPEAPQAELSLALPASRFHAALAVQNDTLWIYGGTIEKADRELFYNDLYSINLEKLDGVRTHFSIKDAEDWVDSESEDEDDDDGEDDDSDGSESGPEEDLTENRPSVHKISDAELTRLRAEKAAKKAAALEAAEAEADEAAEVEEKDPTPHPRPFESLREFFERTSNDWQNHLIHLASFITNPPQRTIKELRHEAFKMAEQKWWDSREEMRAAEDEMEEAGIGEVVELTAKGAVGGVKRR